MPRIPPMHRLTPEQAREFGRRGGLVGGRSRSERKAAAARENGKKAKQRSADVSAADERGES